MNHAKEQPTMDLRLLRYFLAIVEERSITGAAEYLMISQPSLSRQIKEFERRIGQRLFDRGTRTIALTPAGELLRERAEEIVALADRAERELASLDRPLGGPVYVGAGETDAMHYLARAMHDVAAGHPQVRFHVYSGDSEDVIAKLDSGLLDFALVFEPFDGSKYSWLPVPARDVWGLVMRRDDPLAAKGGITVDDLRSTPLILSRQTRIDRQFGVWGDGLNEGMLHVVGTYNLLNNGAIMVAEGLGCALTLEGIINVTGDSELTFRPLEPRCDAGLSVIWKTTRRFSRQADAFLAALRTRLGE